MSWLLIRRVTAFFVDIVLLFLVLAPIGFLVLTALGGPPASPSGPEVWLAIVLNFSVPTWTYFVWSDRSVRGATLGKWLLGVRVVRVMGGRLGMAQALTRTAVKLLPWETVHLSAFALSVDFTVLELRQVIGLSIANGLAVLYFVAAAWTRGRRSVHDYVAATAVCPVPSVTEALPPTGPA